MDRSHSRKLIERLVEPKWPDEPSAPDGWEFVDTGGGCTGFQHDIAGGKYWLITDGEAQAPENPNEPCVLTLYDEDGASEDSWDVKNLAAAVKLALGRVTGADTLLPEN